MKKKIALLTSALLVCGILLYFLQALLVPKYMDNTKEGALIGEYYENAGNNDVIFGKQDTRGAEEQTCHKFNIYHWIQITLLHTFVECILQVGNTLLSMFSGTAAYMLLIRLL